MTASSNPPSNASDAAAWRVLVIDDERPARAKLLRLLKEDPRFCVVGEACDGIDALEKIDALSPDVLVLDIQMPGLDGFQVLDALGDATPCTVVFSTAYDAHALRAFDAHAVDYLLKPYDAARLRRAMDKAAAQCVARGAFDHRALLLDVDLRSQITLKTAEGAWITLQLTQIQRLSSANKHSVVTLRDGTSHNVRRPLRELSARLGVGFVRVHRSTLINVETVASLEALDHGDALLTLTDKSTVILSRTYRHAFLARWTRPA